MQVGSLDTSDTIKKKKKAKSQVAALIKLVFSCQYGCHEKDLLYDMLCNRIRKNEPSENLQIRDATQLHKASSERS